MEPIIYVSSLKKKYGANPAVNSISFLAQKGQTLALLGPNGAGKSTTLDVLCTFLVPDSGTVRLNGYSLGQHNDLIRQTIGIVFQNGVLDHALTVRENLAIRGSFYGLRGNSLKDQIQKTAAITNITDLLNKSYGHLSGGQKRRCDIARALIHDPQILFLDEPTTGLDPQMRQCVWNTIEQLKQKHNITIVLTTHYLEEASYADQILIMNQGTIIASGSPNTLKEYYTKDKLIITTHTPAYLLSYLNTHHIPYDHKKDQIHISLNQTRNALPILKACDGYYNNFEVQKGCLEEAYLSIIGKENREENSK